MRYYIASILVLLLFAFGCKNQNVKEQTTGGDKSLTSKQVQVKRYCQTLDLKDDPKLIEEYKYWHQKEHIWPEITKGIHEVGILDMEIYLLGTRLCMIMDAPEDFNFDQQMAKLAQLPRQAEWEAFVSKFQKSSPDAKSSEKWKLMDKIFDLP
jgi:L-rhamnose mutarotase